MPFTHDGLREFEAQRTWMHGRLLDHAGESDSAWQLLEGPIDARLSAAGNAVDAFLS